MPAVQRREESAAIFRKCDALQVRQTGIERHEESPMLRRGCSTPMAGGARQNIAGRGDQQAGFFQRHQKVGGRQYTVLRMAPAHQYFSAAPDTVGADDRLEIRFKFAAPERQAQIILAKL